MERKKKSNGRPKKLILLTDEMLEKIKDFSIVQMTMEQIAYGLNLTVDRFLELRAQHAEIDLLINECRTMGIATVAGKIFKAARAGDVPAQKFILERKGGWHNKNQIEISGVDGKPVSISSTTISAKLTPEEAQKLYMELISEGKTTDKK
jgi:hypothetical protein